MGLLRVLQSRRNGVAVGGEPHELRLVRVEAQHYRMPFQRPSSTGGRSTSSGNNFLVTVTLGQGAREFTGIGECQPRHALTGDGDRQGNAAWSFLRSAGARVHSRALSFHDRESAVSAVREVMAELAVLAAEYGTVDNGELPFRGTLLGIEVALLDAVSRALGLQIAELLGKQRDELGVSASAISSNVTLDEIAKRVAKQDKYPTTRVNGAGSAGADWDRLETAARANRSVGDDKPIWMDFTTAFGVDEAASFVDGVVTRMRAGTVPASVVLEGMVPPDQVTVLPRLQRQADEACRGSGLDLRIMPDEGIRCPADLRRLNELGGCRALNIMPAKVGGLLAGLELARMAVEADRDVRLAMGGLLGASDVTVWALHNLARALPRLDYLTASPPVRAEARITDPVVMYRERGSNVIAGQSAPGLGARLLPESVRPYRVRSFDSATERAAEGWGAVWDEVDIESLRADKESVDASIHATLKRTLHRNAMREADAAYRKKVQELLDIAEPRHMTHLMARELENNDLSLRSSLSFTALMFEQSEARRLGAFRPAWLLDNKTNAYAFVDELGVRRPASDRKTYRFAEIEQAHPVVIKPVRGTGSRGAYAVFAPDRIRHLFDGKELSSWAEMAAHAGKLMAPGARRRLPDRWMVEELVLEDGASHRLATDVKFYACYGEVLLVRESRRLPGGTQAVQFWTGAGERTDVGIPDEPLPEARGATPEQCELVREISRRIPVPFMRIDMLRGEDELVFGEFTPRPGGFEQLNAEWDRAFAEGWVRAEGRIIEDVLTGKDFSAFAKATGTAQ
ncbi:hypothetical protein H0B56_00090 [Haloechinothrix sp. YIM 98757]|uniref:ATP-grasp domain-containing protein n=1 Tax=Haloechinothrix aidingensis TaxID=2752311 RepID=A0A838A6U7_9PSEU|nr:ATP-grasp fold amidoligase family protein [Haloechinothrix aidingensis]MBA0123939.1 hypothetical protein [Haloechinothrix aidingensis]